MITHHLVANATRLLVFYYCTMHVRDELASVRNVFTDIHNVPADIHNISTDAHDVFLNIRNCYIRVQRKFSLWADCQ